jgi:hypothetical protein
MAKSNSKKPEKGNLAEKAAQIEESELVRRRVALAIAMDGSLTPPAPRSGRK